MAKFNFLTDLSCGDGIIFEYPVTNIKWFKTTSHYEHGIKQDTKRWIGLGKYKDQFFLFFSGWYDEDYGMDKPLDPNYRLSGYICFNKFNHWTISYAGETNEGRR